jgi:flavin reductase (DIM6/NTAB) family NADH-FMN oxidoreductase RutF
MEKIKTLSSEEIANLDRSYRRDFINRITGAKAAWILGSFHPDFGENLALFSSVVHVGANPPLIGIVFRPSLNRLHSLRNISETKLFSLNSLPFSLHKEMHSASANWDEDVNDFQICGLQKVAGLDHPIPLIKEATVRMLLEPKEKIRIQSNSTHFLVSEIKKIEIGYSRLDSEELPLPDGLTYVSGLDLYCNVESVESMPYASSK